MLQSKLASTWSGKSRATSFGRRRRPASTAEPDDVAELDATEQRRVAEEVGRIELAAGLSRVAASTRRSFPDDRPDDLRQPQQVHLRRGERAERVALGLVGSPPNGSAQRRDELKEDLAGIRPGVEAVLARRNPGRPPRREIRLRQKLLHRLDADGGAIDLRIEMPAPRGWRRVARRGR